MSAIRVRVHLNRAAYQRNGVRFTYNRLLDQIWQPNRVKKVVRANFSALVLTGSTDSPARHHRWYAPGKSFRDGPSTPHDAQRALRNTGSMRLA